jgi:hypothetical protein
VKRNYYFFRNKLKIWSRLLRLFNPSFVLQFIKITRLMISDRVHNKKVVILDIEELGYIQYILPIVVLLKKHNLPISFYIATTYIEYKNELDVFGVSDAKIFNPNVSCFLLFTDIFLSASIYGVGPKCSYRINISHNLPVKFETYPKEHLLNYNVHFLTGPLQRTQYENMYKKLDIEMDDVKMIDVGYPKIDYLLNGGYKKDGVLNELDLDPNNNTILYAPAWDPGASLRSFGEQVIEELLKLDNINLIVKLHPVSYTPKSSPNFKYYTGGVDWGELFSKYEKHENFRHMIQFSLDPFLAASDLLITDISSAALEFILLDKPVIFMHCPEFYNKTLKEWGQNSKLIMNDIHYNAGRNAGKVVYNLHSIGNAVTHQLHNNSQYSDKRRLLSHRILYNNGCGTIEAVIAINKLLKMTTSTLV